MKKLHPTTVPHGNPRLPWGIQYFRLAFGVYLLAGLLVLSACHKKTNSVGGDAFGQQLPAAANVDLKAIDQKYIGVIFLNHHGFKSIEEYTNSAQVTLPPAPANMKYIINSKGYIDLVNL